MNIGHLVSISWRAAAFWSPCLIGPVVFEHAFAGIEPEREIARLGEAQKDR
jgi:hypothetical protein